MQKVGGNFFILDFCNRRNDMNNRLFNKRFVWNKALQSQKTNTIYTQAKIEKLKGLKVQAEPSTARVKARNALEGQLKPSLIDTLRVLSTARSNKKSKPSCA